MKIFKEKEAASEGLSRKSREAKGLKLNGFGQTTAGIPKEETC